MSSLNNTYLVVGRPNGYTSSVTTGGGVDISGLFYCASGCILAASGGYVGIGITNPTAMLHLPANATIRADANLTLDSSVNAVYLATNGVARYFASGSSFSPQADNTYQLGWSNVRWIQVNSTNGTIQTSDSSLKNAVPLEYGLKEMVKINTIKFKWKSQQELPDDKPEKNFEYYGFCADELASLFPELVYNEDTSAPVQMNYSEILPVVVNAVKELKSENDQLSSQIQDLQSKLNEVLACLSAAGIR